jgi:hypothetical protein
MILAFTAKTPRRMVRKEPPRYLASLRLRGKMHSPKNERPITAKQLRNKIPKYLFRPLLS